MHYSLELGPHALPRIRGLEGIACECPKHFRFSVLGNFVVVNCWSIIVFKANIIRSILVVYIATKHFL